MNGDIFLAKRVEVLEAKVMDLEARLAALERLTGQARSASAAEVSGR